MKRWRALLTSAALVVALVHPSLPPTRPVVAQQGDLPFFPETGFGIATPAFADYFAKRGGLRTFGYPISNAFLFLGTEVQFFQRQIVQRRPDGGVGTLNLLDADLMPYTRINGSTFPAADPAVLAGVADPASPNHGARVLQFVSDHAPNEWGALPVRFRDTFLTTVRYEEAFPNREVGPGIMPAINLELWGIPTSLPAADPSNAGFVYLRFQRGIMHFDSATGATQGLLLADYLKAILTGAGLPPDLESDARASRFYRQYDQAQPRALARPAELPGTDLTGAFGPGRAEPPVPTQAPVATGPRPVPAEYRATYDTLAANLDTFADVVSRRAPAPTPHRALTFGAELSSANCNRGPALLEPNALDAVRLQLDALQSIGIQGATHCLHYPLLYSGFPDSSRYLAFYKAVAAEIRQRGMQHAIDLQTIFSGSAFSNLTVDYSDLTLDVYAERKAQMAQTIVDQIAPDYLSLGGEPDTEARLTGLRELDDPVRHTEFLRNVLARVNRKTTKLGAGSGTWVSTQFVRNYAANTSIDFIDIHIYPVGPAIVNNTLQIVDIARQFNKPVVVYEAWLYKTAGGESQGAGIAASETIYARDAFTFWQPLDQRFLSTLVALANAERMAYISPFWSAYFFGQLEHEPAAATLPPVQVLNAASQVASRGMQARSPTTLGDHYRALIQANRP